MFRYVVMGANARRCSRTQNKIITSKTELLVKKMKHLYSYVTLCYYITLSRCTLYVTLRKGIPRLRDSVEYLIISALHYRIIPFTVIAWSDTTSLLRALEAKWNRVRS